MNKLLIIGSNSIHVYNYVQLIKPYFEEIIFITDSENNTVNYKDVKLLYTHFTIKKPIKFLKGISFIKNIIKKFRPDIIHAHQLTTHSFQTILANRNTKIPIVFTAWGSDVLLLPQMGFLYRLMSKYILRQGHYFTVDAQYMAEEMTKTANRSLRILNANFGIELNASIPLQKQRIIYSNRQLQPLYRIDKILEGFARFVNERSSEGWQLIVGAEGADKDMLKEKANSLGIANQVEFVGWLDREKNQYYYNISTCYISVPQSDGTSVSLLEAMAAGCIPILSDLPANREWVNDGINGYIVKDFSTNYIEEAMQLDAEKVKIFNKIIIEERGTKAINAEKFSTFYKEIIQEQI